MVFLFLAYRNLSFFLQAIVNEDALGDVIAMRMQIQQLKVLCLTWILFYLFTHSFVFF